MHGVHRAHALAARGLGVDDRAVEADETRRFDRDGRRGDGPAGGSSRAEVCAIAVLIDAVAHDLDRVEPSWKVAAPGPTPQSVKRPDHRDLRGARAEAHDRGNRLGHRFSSHRLCLFAPDDQQADQKHEQNVAEPHDRYFD